MLEEGRYRSAAEIAEAEGRNSELLRPAATLLVPDIVEAILRATAEGNGARRHAEEAAGRLGGAAATDCFPMMSGSPETRFVLPAP
jgi:hypothetical protein